MREILSECKMACVPRTGTLRMASFVHVWVSLCVTALSANLLCMHLLSIVGELGSLLVARALVIASYIHS